MAPFSKTPALIALSVAAAFPLAACNDYGGGPRYASDRGHDGYYLRDEDSIYRDNDGRYYCRKPDGTTGLVVGGLAGGVLGNIIAPGGSKTIGTILGAGAGALAGRAVDRGSVRCR
jgi:hypothetical protein